MDVGRGLGLVAATLLYFFCGAGVYWNFLWWFHAPTFAGLSGGIIPFFLLWIIWHQTKAARLD
jgi:hypothetical protein